jgi:hypothetical protein
MTFIYILLIANLALTGWVMLAVNETDRTNTKMMVDMNNNIRLLALGLDEVRELIKDKA